MRILEEMSRPETSKGDPGEHVFPNTPAGTVSVEGRGSPFRRNGDWVWKDQTSRTKKPELTSTVGIGVDKVQRQEHKRVYRSRVKERKEERILNKRFEVGMFRRDRS